MHGNGQRLVNTHDGVQLEIERSASGSGTTNCHIFTIFRLADEHHGQAAGIDSALGTAPHKGLQTRDTSKRTNIERHGPQKAALQRLDRGPHEFGQDTVSSEPAAGPLLGAL